MAAALRPLRALSRAALEPRDRRLHLSAARYGPGHREGVLGWLGGRREQRPPRSARCR